MTRSVRFMFLAMIGALLVSWLQLHQRATAPERGQPQAATP